MDREGKKVFSTRAGLCFSSFYISLFRSIFGTFSHLVMNICVAQSVSRNNGLKNHHEVKNIFISQRKNRGHFHVRVARSFNVFRNGLIFVNRCRSFVTEFRLQLPGKCDPIKRLQQVHLKMRYFDEKLQTKMCFTSFHPLTHLCEPSERKTPEKLSPTKQKFQQLNSSTACK